jgi:acyl-CoA thioester hydrolase
MPLTHTRTFRVRYYECDAYGHVNHANYLRYMQETAFDATAAAGYDVNRYEEMDRLWLVRETEIEYLRPLRYGDSVQVKTWVQDFRRIRSRRAYKFSLVGSGEIVARATTDWVFLDRTAGRPTAIPEEMKVAFFPEGTPELAPARARFPSAPLPPLNVFTQRRRVAWREIDQAQHVNNAVYLTYIEDAGAKMVAAHGWPITRMATEGFAVVARHHRIEYKVPALLDDELEIATWLSDVKSTTAIRHTTIMRVSDQALLARARTVHVWVDLQTGKSTAIPEAFLADLELRNHLRQL